MSTEPEYPRLLAKCSLIGMPTPAMRSAPEVLVQELMRTIFYDRKRSNTQQFLDPDNDGDFNDEELFFIRALQGRQKAAGSKSSYYCPAYPQLVRNSWMRKKDPVTVNGFLLEGPIGHCLNSLPNRPAEIERFSKELVEALLGDTARSVEVRELFARATEVAEEQYSKDKAIEKLVDKLSKDIDGGDLQAISKDGIADEFSNVAYRDFLILLRIEKFMPRHQWLALLMAYLRIVMSVWLLSQAKCQSMMLGWMLDAISGDIPSQEDIERQFELRSRSLIFPSINPFREGLERKVRSYGRDRVKLSVLLNELASNEVGVISKEQLSCKLVVARSSRKGLLSIHDLLSQIKGCEKYLNHCKSIYPNEKDPINTHLSRECEQWPMYRRPLKVGQTKNMIEFFDVLKKSEGFDHRASHLLEPSRVGRKIFWRTSPGQLTIQMMVLFAALETNADDTKRRRVMLHDLEEHFAKYGIDYTVATDGRSLLMERLSDLGLLISSPDAGAYVQLNNPYQKLAKQIDNPYADLRLETH